MDSLRKRLIVIDSNSVIHRAFHALPPLTTKKGEIVGAVYGFLLVFLKALKDFQPDFIAAVFDFPAPTFRHKRFKKYKANRPPTPKELYQQIPIIKEILKTFNVSIFEKQGFEADDIIGTLAHLASIKQMTGEETNVSSSPFANARVPEVETIILSGDSDTFQLINTQTRVYALRKGVKDIVLYDEEMIREKFQGLKPEQLIDFKALKGDPSDNIPGVPGVGEKTAIKLVQEFGSLENLYQKLQIRERGEAEQSVKVKAKLSPLSNSKSQVPNIEPLRSNGEEAKASSLPSKPSSDGEGGKENEVFFDFANARVGEDKGENFVLSAKLKAKLLEYKEQAFLSKELVEIRKDVFVDLKLEDCQWRGYNKKKAIKIFQKLGFSSLVKRLDIDVCKKSYK